MANGGINDQIEGGFYRYSVDKAWMIPHFEKMLYTNAELLSDYAKAYKITKDRFYKKQIDEITTFVDERFLNEGLLYSASDADSKVGKRKEEGAYFVFEYDKTKKFLEKSGFKNTKDILSYFNITPKGNFEKAQTNPYLTTKKEPKDIKNIKKVLQQLREQKEYPFIDYKILTAWNAMYISALFEANHNKQALFLLDTLVKKLYVDATIQAIKRYKEHNILIILGGDDKGVSLNPLFELMIPLHVKIFAIGSNTDKIVKLAHNINKEVEACYELENAMNIIQKEHTKDTTVLLSPAAASLDQFSSYAQRGELFKELALKD